MRIKPTARTARALTITAVAAASITGATMYGIAQASDAHGACHVSQVVYSNNDGQPVGTWSASLVPGQEVFEPDDMVATCLENGTLDVAQP